MRPTARYRGGCSLAALSGGRRPVAALGASHRREALVSRGPSKRGWGGGGGGQEPATIPPPTMSSGIVPEVRDHQADGYRARDACRPRERTARAIEPSKPDEVGQPRDEGEPAEVVTPDVRDARRRSHRKLAGDDAIAAGLKPSR